MENYYFSRPFVFTMVLAFLSQTECDINEEIKLSSSFIDKQKFRAHYVECGRYCKLKKKKPNYIVEIGVGAMIWKREKLLNEIVNKDKKKKNASRMHHQNNFWMTSQVVVESFNILRSIHSTATEKKKLWKRTFWQETYNNLNRDQRFFGLSSSYPTKCHPRCPSMRKNFTVMLFIFI